MAEPVRHLRVVEHDDNGEVIESPCPGCRDHVDTITGLERDIRGWAIRYAELKRDKKLEAEEHPCWEAAQWTFRYWKRACNHPRTRWGHDRFWLIEPFLVDDKWGKTLRARVALCMLAIDGAAFDSWAKPRKNGSTKVFNEFDRVFATTGSFEEFVKRAPADAKVRCAAIRSEL